MAITNFTPKVFTNDGGEPINATNLNEIQRVLDALNNYEALSKTIYIVKKDILGIVDDGWYYGVEMINVPTVNVAGYIRVMTMSGTNTHRVVYWRPHDSSIEYVNVLSGDDDWLGWTETLTDKGGMLKGSLQIRTNVPHIDLNNNDKNYASLYKHASVTGDYDYGTLIRDSSEIMGKDTYLDLVLRHKQAKNGNKNGCLTLYYRQNGVGTEYNIFGEHNKPTGSYTGNYTSGQAIREVITGGLGNGLLLWEPSYPYQICLVTLCGVIFVNSGTVNGLTRAQCYFENGVLYLPGSRFNAEGHVYAYQVL